MVPEPEAFGGFFLGNAVVPNSLVHNDTGGFLGDHKARSFRSVVAFFAHYSEERFFLFFLALFTLVGRSGGRDILHPGRVVEYIR